MGRRARGAVPRSGQADAGQRLTNASLDALVATVEAAMTSGAARIVLLREANRALTVARILLRATRDRRLLSIAQHEHVMQRVDAWGRQLGGWIRSEAAK
jgi:hypothetical protein